MREGVYYKTWLWVARTFLLWLLLIVVTTFITVAKVQLVHIQDPH